MANFLRQPVQGFQGFGGLSEQELLNLALQSLGTQLQGAQGAPTAAARAHAIELADRLRSIDPSWDATQYLRSYVQPGVAYGPEVTEALQNYAYNELRRDVPEDIAKQWLPTYQTGDTAASVLRDLDFAAKWHAQQGRVMDPSTGDFVMSQPSQAYMNMYGTNWMAQSGQGPNLFNPQGGINQETANAGIQQMRQASGLPVTQRVNVAQDLIDLFQGQGFTRDMIETALLQHAGALTTDELNTIYGWMNQSDLPREYRGDTTMAWELIREYFRSLDDALRAGGVQIGVPTGTQFGLMQR